MMLDTIKRPSLNRNRGPKFQRSAPPPYRSYTMPLKTSRKVLVVEGELKTLLNGNPHSVIMQIVCRDQKDAEEVLLERQGSYKKLRIKEITI